MSAPPPGARALSKRALRGKRLGVLAVAMTVATVVFLAGVQYWRGLFDLSIYYGAIHHWVRGGALYDYLLPGTSYGFTYPPFAALVMLPMALASYPVVVAASAALNVGCLLLLAYWFVRPIARRQGWPVWFAVVAAGCLLALLEPVYDTVSFGQVNLILMVVVFADARLLAGTTRFVRHRRCAGVGAGLATALKLTPGLFIVYLLLAGRRRAAAVASGTACGATLLAAIVAPHASWTYWTEALWQTERVGSPAYISNQSLLGVLARLDPSQPPNRAVWLVLVAVVLAGWAYAVRKVLGATDVLGGFALTGVAACLVSPISWVHHLVWLIPALVLTVDAGLCATGARRRRILLGAGCAYVTLVSSLVFLWRYDASGIDGVLGGSAFCWVAVGLLLCLPVVRWSTPLVGSYVRNGGSRWAAYRSARGTAATGGTRR
ncbi:MAG TPA: glycosyltransferase 87 family protein [Actinopolymorphaceae bacterium]